MNATTIGVLVLLVIAAERIAARVRYTRKITALASDLGVQRFPHETTRDLVARIRPRFRATKVK